MSEAIEARERVIKAIHDYRRKNGRPPKRVTVDYEVARNLDAAMVDCCFAEPSMGNIPLLTDGAYVTVLGIPVVADLDENEVIDIRS